MGEEKPDEELMGKRKSSPRLSTTLVECRYPKDAQEMVFYTCFITKFFKRQCMWYDNVIIFIWL
ncbi:single-stranded DNA-binding protein [Paenibacillus sp. M-152]|nr:single-stranded DNA-binding protein [Paenibacillus sp. M-152]